MFGHVKHSEFRELWKSMYSAYGRSDSNDPFGFGIRSSIEERFRQASEIRELTARVAALECRVEDTEWDLMPNAMRHEDI